MNASMPSSHHRLNKIDGIEKDECADQRNKRASVFYFVIRTGYNIPLLG